MSDLLFDFLLIFAAASVFAALLNKTPILRVPTSVGYLLFGMFLQFTSIPLSDSEIHWLNHLGDFGLLYLMYLAGLEVDVRQLRLPKNRDGINPLVLGSSIFCATLLMSFLLAILLVHGYAHRTHPYLLALLLSTTSLGVIMPVLEEMDLLQSRYGQALLVSAFLADFLTMLLLSVFLGSIQDADWRHVLLTLAILPFSVILYHAIRWLQKVSFIRRQTRDTGLRIRIILALLAVTCTLADATGAEPILGSFLIGMLISRLSISFKSKFKDYSYGIGYGFFIPIFFISVGFDFDFHSLAAPSALRGIVLLALSMALVKVVPSLYFVKPFGFKKAMAGGILLSARLSLVAAAAQIAVRLHLLSTSVADTLILVAVGTSLFAPIGFSLLFPKQETV